MRPAQLQAGQQALVLTLSLVLALVLTLVPALVLLVQAQVLMWSCGATRAWKLCWC